ncbi:hypothetical protein H5410_031908 [Solanum commersonii]|uniref:Uncharacterized protein n=1 Tax=Solanum commersonii TaxID=4109 RepID=A0A9J5YJK5_SOLCO|nr:hypothetical protein H5410_031908 [Solanum commersonii]
MGFIEIHKPNIGSNSNNMIVFESSNLEDKVSNLELEHRIESSNLKNLDESVSIDKLASDLLGDYCWFCSCQVDVVYCSYVRTSFLESFEMWCSR